ncbi:MAG: response regulator [Ignavibacteriae bacterium]|nr:response regulator [Ignavibacteriota bacterium]
MNKTIKVLYVDDEESLRMLVKNQLSREGLSVDTADDGDTAVKMLKKNIYDVLLLDIRMPRMSGIDVLRYLKEHNISSRIIMLTAVDDLAVAIEAVKHGANDYVTKPFDFDSLVASIHRVVAQ